MPNPPAQPLHRPVSAQALLDQCLADDPEIVVNNAAILFKEAGLVADPVTEGGAAAVSIKMETTSTLPLLLATVRAAVPYTSLSSLLLFSFRTGRRRHL